MFNLIPDFQNKEKVATFSLSLVLLEPTVIPWVLLLPRRPGILQISELSREDRQQLWEEVDETSSIIQKLFPTDRLNIAAIGNKCPQLHVHGVSRSVQDEAWPEVVWGRSLTLLSPEDYRKRADFLRKNFDIKLGMSADDTSTMTMGAR